MPILTATLNNTALALLIGFIVLFAWIAIYYKDKYHKIHDELLDLADARGFFTKKPSIMRADERQLFDVLIKLYGDKYYIYPQARLATILDVKNDVKDHDNLYRHIDHLSLDFVLFDKQAMSPVLAIELNGKSHLQFNRRNRDQKIENVLTKAGIRFISFPVTNTYNETKIREALAPLLT